MYRPKNDPLETALDGMTVTEAPLSEAEKSRILALAAQKAGIKDVLPQGGAPTAKKEKGQAHVSRRAAVFLVAAAVLGAFSVTAVAAPALLKMLEGKIGFYADAPVQSEVDDPLDAPRGEYPATAAQAEAYNAPVGQTVSCNGVDVTLDNISMDAATMDVWFTITGEQAVRGALSDEMFEPEWSQLVGQGPDFIWGTTVNGEETAVWDIRDFYRVDDSTLRLWVHYLLEETPRGDVVTVALAENTRALGVPGSWEFAVELDGGSVRAGGRETEPGVFETAVPAQDGTQTKSLRLTRLAFGPVGGSITLDKGDRCQDENGRWQGSVEGLDPGELLITDDTGRELFVTRDASQGLAMTGKVSCNVVAPAETAQSVTLTPVLCSDAADVEWRTVTTQQMQQGVKVATNPLGGFTLQNYQAENGVVTWEAVPYGWVGGRCLELIWEDGSELTLAEDTFTDAETGEETTFLKSALASVTVDPQTGVYTCRRDFYAATDEELAKLTSWSYQYESGYSLDTAHAVTLPLEPLK